MATDLVLFLVTLSIGFITIGAFALLHKTTPTDPQLEADVPPLSTEPRPRTPRQAFPPSFHASVPAMMPSPVPQPAYGLYPNPPLAYGVIPPNNPMNPLQPLQPPTLVNGAYQVFHQRYNKQLHNWEPFNPVQSSYLLAEEAVFVVYFRHESPGAGGQVRKVVEIRSPSLRNVLKDCLRSVEFVENGYYEVAMQYVGLGQHSVQLNRPREPKVSFEQNPQVPRNFYLCQVDGRLMRRSCRL